MPSALVLIAGLVVGPIAFFILLASLPVGPGRAWAFLGCALALLALWLARPLGWGSSTGDPAGDGYLRAAAGSWFLAFVLAGALQVARRRLKRGGRLAYPLAVFAALAVLLLVLAPILGVSPGAGLAPGPPIPPPLAPPG